MNKFLHRVFLHTRHCHAILMKFWINHLWYSQKCRNLLSDTLELFQLLTSRRWHLIKFYGEVVSLKCHKIHEGKKTWDSRNILCVQPCTSMRARIATCVAYYVPCSETNCCTVETNVEFAKRMRMRGRRNDDSEALQTTKKLCRNFESYESPFSSIS